MAFYNKLYNYQKHENFDVFLKSVGLSEDKIAAMLSQKPVQKIVQNGDSYVITQTAARGSRETTFKSGVEFDDTIGVDNTPIKSTFTVSGNTVTQLIKSPMGTATCKMDFNGDDLVVTITSDTFNGVAKRYYKA